MTDQAEAPDPEASLTPEARRFRNELSPAERARLDRNLAGRDTSGPTRIGALALKIVEDAKVARQSPPVHEIYAELINLSRISKPFALIPGEIIKMPEFSELSGNALHTLNILFVFRKNKTGLATPGHREILRIRGMDPESDSDRRQLKRAITELIQAGFIWLKKKGSEGNASQYFVATTREQIIFIRSISTGQPTTPRGRGVRDLP